MYSDFISTLFLGFAIGFLAAGYLFTWFALRDLKRFADRISKPLDEVK